MKLISDHFSDSSVVLTNAQRQLVESHISLVEMHLSKRVPTSWSPCRGREYDDLFQLGCMALIQAAMSFDPASHGSFSSYALLRIRALIHKALYEYFGTIRVPMSVLKRRLDGRSSTNWPSMATAQQLTPQIEAVLFMESVVGGSGETIRHRIRFRFERAVRLALRIVAEHPWRNRNPFSVIQRIAQERLLITHERERTPQRQIARESGISSGRIAEYERLLWGTVQEQMTSDPQLPILVQFAEEDSARFDLELTEKQHAILAKADMDAFESEFGRMNRKDKTEVVYRLIEHSSPAVDEVVRNLYRLANTDFSELLPAVA